MMMIKKIIFVVAFLAGLALGFYLWKLGEPKVLQDFQFFRVEERAGDVYLKSNSIYEIGQPKADRDRESMKAGDDDINIEEMYYDDRIWMGNRDNLELPLIEFKGEGV